MPEPLSRVLREAAEEQSPELSTTELWCRGRQARRRRRTAMAALGVAAVLVATLGGIGIFSSLAPTGTERPDVAAVPTSPTRDSAIPEPLPSTPPVTTPAWLIDNNTPPTKPTVHGNCNVGERTDYFVPGPTGDAVVIGCAVLGSSGQAVEFSVQDERIGGKPHLCINPAYNGRGQRGIYIPASCGREPLDRQLDVIWPMIPRQAVKNYEFVLWGTAAADVNRVVAEYGDEEAEAAVFPVDSSVTGEVDVARPFNVFVVELPVEAACREVVAQAPGAQGGTVRVDARPHLCKVALNRNVE